MAENTSYPQDWYDARSSSVPCNRTSSMISSGEVRALINASTEEDLPVGLAEGILITYSAILLMINIFLNGLLLFTILYVNNRKRLTPCHVIIMGLGLSDLSMALLYLPLVFVLLASGSRANCQLLCIALSVLERGLIPASIWGIAFVSFDRYLYIVCHHKYHQRMSVQRSLAGLLVVWSVAVLFGATSWLLADHTTSPSGSCLCHLTLDFYGIYHLLYSAVYITLAFILPTTLILVFYGFIIRVAHSSFSKRDKNPFRLAMTSSRVGSVQQLSRAGSPASALSNGGVTRSTVHQTLYLYEVKTARIIFLVLSFFLVCVTPYFAINMVVSSGHWVVTGFPQKIYLALILLLFTNNSCNPLLYGFANRRLRRSLINYIWSKINFFGTNPDLPIRKRSASKLSVMGDSSSADGHRCRRHSSDISALSAMSREAFVSRDLLEAYNQYITSGSEERTQELQPSQSGFSISQKDGVSDVHSSEPIIPGPSHRDDQSLDSHSYKSLSPTFSNDHPSPIRKPLFSRDSKRTLALKQITHAALLFSTYQHPENVEYHGLKKGLLGGARLADAPSLDRSADLANSTIPAHASPTSSPPSIQADPEEFSNVDVL